MLRKLSIKNVALIDSAEIDFTDGLNVLSGETGAGKSVILESLNFVLGAKADKTLIRSGESECMVKAEFDVSENSLIKDVYSNCEIDYDDYLIIQRKFNVDGKGTIKINGETANSSILKKFTSLLVDIHGQSEHFHLLKNSNQLYLLDKFGGEKVDNLKTELKEEFAKLKKVRDELEEFGGDETKRLIRLDVLNYQINEIEKVSLKEGEEEELLSIKQKLTHQRKISDSLSSINACLSSEGGVCDLISNATKILNSISEYGEEYNKISDRLNAVLSELEDISSETSSSLDEFELPDYNINEIEDRLDSIKSLKKKYGVDFAQINEFYENAKLEKENLENFNELAEKLLTEKEKLEVKIYKIYCDLCDARRNSAKELSENVLVELKELGMPKSQFVIDFNDKPQLGDCKFDSSNGFDKIEFMFSANLGEPLKPLSLIISGGEMSRFMLSIKAQTARLSELSTFIFDEIDAGISGVTAKVVAEKLAKISRKVQVIAITHLPQISAMGDNNLLIEKNEGETRTITNVKKLSTEQKIKEIARLISGNVQSNSSLKHAEELIENANKFKQSLS